MPESECGFEKSSWRVSLFVIIVAAILGTIQEVIYRQAADGVFGSTHHEPKQVQLNGTWRKCSTSVWAFYISICSLLAHVFVLLCDWLSSAALAAYHRAR